MEKIIDINPLLAARRAREEKHDRGTKIAVLALSGAVAVAVAAGVSREASEHADPHDFMQTQLEKNGQLYRSASVTIEKGTTFYDRPAVFDDAQGTSVAGTFPYTEHVETPIVIRSGNQLYGVVPNPTIENAKRPNTIEELGEQGVAVPLQPGALQFEAGSGDEPMPFLNEFTKIPNDANKISIDALE